MGEHRDRERLRTTFETVAERYGASRPTYPEELLDDLVELAAIPPGGRILEIGPGTGKASAALASRGHSLAGVELGPQLAEVARRNLAPFRSSLRGSTPGSPRRSRDEDVPRDPERRAEVVRPS